MIKLIPILVLKIQKNQKSNNQFTGVTDESIEDLIGGIMQ